MSLAEPIKAVYRPEIDGLRAIAVLSVVIYHAFPALLSGGFVGVDIFFVISGYLITSHIFTSLDAGRFSFADFFARRVRRIFPALVLVMASALLFGWFALLSEELQQLGKHVAGGAGFIVNFILVGEAGYFDAAAHAKPLLHLWSLAVEEQFYIIWPLVLWLAYRWRFSLLGITLLVAAVSFYVNIRFVLTKPTEVFFWPFGRFWELLSGSLLAWVMLYRQEEIGRAKARIDGFVGRVLSVTGAPVLPAVAETAMAFAGLCLLGYGFVAITAADAFPSTQALVPVFGAVLIIAGGGAAWSNRMILMNPVAVWFGLISYPLYLWHWPLLSFLQIVKGGEVPHRDARVVAVLLAIGLAWLTVRFVERPLRFGRRNLRPKLIGLIGAMGLLGLTGMWISQTDFSASRTLDSLMIERAGAGNLHGASSRWYRGKEGWLFLGNAFDSTVAKLTLAQTPSEADLAREEAVFARLAQAAAAHDVSLAVLIGPNKSTLYPEYLPDAITPAKQRYVTDFMTRLTAVDHLTVVDPFADMMRAKAGAGLLYYRTDTHWNDKGAFLAFAALAQRMGWPVPEVSFIPVAPQAGDLITISGLDDFPLEAGDRWQVKWAREPVLAFTALPDQPETSFGRAEIVSNAAPLSEQTVWVIGDSFTHAMAPFIDATFREVQYLGHANTELAKLPDALARAETKPDAIIVVRVERSF